MTNEEKFKTPEERRKAFFTFCSKNICARCEAKSGPSTREKCILYWLALEAEEKPLPCPCCGGEAISYEDLLTCDNGVYGYRVRCTVCGMASRVFVSREVAIAAWNRRVK